MAAKLTKKERELLYRAAQFVLAGEWPWEHEDENTQERERRTLERAAEKL